MAGSPIIADRCGKVAASMVRTDALAVIAR
jgi:hypothetical protein